MDEGTSLLGLDSCYMAGELIHHMACWKEHFHICIEKSFPHRCFLTICSLGKENNSFFILVFKESTVQSHALGLECGHP